MLQKVFRDEKQRWSDRKQEPLLSGTRIPDCLTRCSLLGPQLSGLRPSAADVCEYEHRV